MFAAAQFHSHRRSARMSHSDFAIDLLRNRIFFLSQSKIYNFFVENFLQTCQSELELASQELISLIPKDFGQFLDVFWIHLENQLSNFRRKRRKFVQRADIRESVEKMRGNRETARVESRTEPERNPEPNCISRGSRREKRERISHRFS